MTYPHPCTHCGLCCIAITCPIGVALMELPSPKGPCPALEWDQSDPNVSRCGLIANPEKHLTTKGLYRVRFNPVPLTEALGSGLGCCIAARVIHNGTQTDFAALPPETKVHHVQAIRNQSATLIPPP